MSRSANEIIVVGGGAAGIVAAYRAASLGVPVTLLEKKDRLGMKILISGGGKCNVTHAGPMEEVRSAFRPNEARFLKPSFYRFTNEDMVRILEEEGIRLITRPDGRMFPAEGTAKDVVAALRAILDRVGVSIRLNSPVTGIRFEDALPADAPLSCGKGGTSGVGRRVAGIQLGDQFRPARRVVLCVGGSSYPGTGTTGDGWAWVEEAGHTLVKIRAALAPLFLEAPQSQWAGVALRDCTLRARQANKVFVSWRGDLLFTHRGLSGPCALGISREVAERRPAGPVSLEVDLIPDTSPERLALDLREWIAQNPRRLLSVFQEPLLPDRLLGSFMDGAGCPPDLRAAHLPQKSRNRLAQHLKGWPIGSVQHIPLEKGEVVAGGVSLDEVDPQTMRSRKAAGLYLCGEILDIAGPVGGYNLQAAWSTGYVAGETAAGDAG